MILYIHVLFSKGSHVDNKVFVVETETLSVYYPLLHDAAVK